MKFLVDFWDVLHVALWLLWPFCLCVSVFTSDLRHVFAFFCWLCACWAQPWHTPQGLYKSSGPAPERNFWISRWQRWAWICALLWGVHIRSSEISSEVGVAWMQGFWTLHGFEELVNYWDWFLVGSSWIWGCFLGFYSAWIPGLAEAGILSVCWWPCPSVEVDLLVCLDADCCWMAVWVNWLWHQQPESGSCSAQSEGGLDWASWLGEGVMHVFCWDSDGFVEVLMGSA